MREIIFNRALELFAEKGFEGASMRELAKRAGTTPSNVYNYFPSKQALLAEVFETGTAQIRETIEAGRRGEGTDLEAYLRSVLQTVRSNIDLWRLIHQLRHDDQVEEILGSDFTEIIAFAEEELAAYTGAPWLLLSLVDGLAASIILGAPLPGDDEVVASVSRALRAV